MSYPFSDITDVLESVEGRPAWKTRKPFEIQYLLVHHTAGPEDEAPRRIHEGFRYRNLGTSEAPAFAPRIPYHYLVSTTGLQWKVNYDTAVTWHCPSRNRDGLSVCLIGNRQVRECPEDQWWSLVNLAARLMQAFPILALNLGGHRDFYPTLCPGQYVDLPRLRQDVAAAIGRAPA